MIKKLKLYPTKSRSRSGRIFTGCCKRKVLRDWIFSRLWQCSCVYDSPYACRRDERTHVCMRMIPLFTILICACVRFCPMHTMFVIHVHCRHVIRADWASGSSVRSSFSLLQLDLFCLDCQAGLVERINSTKKRHSRANQSRCRWVGCLNESKLKKIPDCGHGFFLIILGFKRWN